MNREDGKYTGSGCPMNMPTFYANCPKMRKKMTEYTVFNDSVTSGISVNY